MGRRGPIPKRKRERRRRNKDFVDSIKLTEPAAPGEEPAVDEDGQAQLQAAAEMPLADDAWHLIARDWYLSLQESGQSRFYEPSDWQAARLVAEVMTRNLNQGRFSAQLFAAVWSAMGELLTTEGARRRARMEIERGEPGAELHTGNVTVLDDYRAAVGG